MGSHARCGAASVHPGLRGHAWGAKGRGDRRWRWRRVGRGGYGTRKMLVFSWPGWASLCRVNFALCDLCCCDVVHGRGKAQWPRHAHQHWRPLHGGAAYQVPVTVMHYCIPALHMRRGDAHLVGAPVGLRAQGVWGVGAADQGAPQRLVGA